MTPKTIRRKKIAENIRFDIFFDDLQDVNEGIIKDYLVIVPKVKNKNGISGTGMLPVLNGKICLLKMYRHATETVLWEIPRGFIEPNEAENISALREMKEETGLDCPLDRVSPLGIAQPSCSTFASTIALFAATDCHIVNDFKPTELGHHDIGFFTPQEVDQLIEKTEIRDAATLIAYYQFMVRQAHHERKENRSP